VVACGGSYVQPNIADVTVTHLLFDNGVRAHIYVSWLHPFKEQRLVVIGSRKMASFDDVAKRLVLYDQRVDLREGEPIPVKGNGEEVPFAHDRLPAALGQVLGTDYGDVLGQWREMRNQMDYSPYAPADLASQVVTAVSGANLLLTTCRDYPSTSSGRRLQNRGVSL
jgi:hypothetical protein